MHLGVLEWICGGGLSQLPLDQIPGSLRREGWTMLSALVSDLCRSSSNSKVSTTIDPRLVNGTQTSGLCRLGCQITQVEMKENASNEPEQVWLEVFRDVDGLIVIAPEIGGVLENLLSEFSRAQIPCFNCSGDFLANACNKYLTSNQLSAAGIAHPATRTLRLVDADWMNHVRANRNSSADADVDQVASLQTSYWAVKPSDGAGCDGLMRLSTQDLNEMLKGTYGQRLDNGLIVQPWMEGIPCSRSAIVDRAGSAHWLPLSTQDLTLNPQPKYHGGTILAGEFLDEADEQKKQMPWKKGMQGDGIDNIWKISSDEMDKLDMLLKKAVNAMGPTPLGWIGVDLLYHVTRRESPFTIIEFNPRLTTSFVGLNSACGGGLADQLVLAAVGDAVRLPKTWTSVRFEC